MTDLDRLFVAVLFVAVLIIADRWTVRRRKYQAMMAAHCAFAELARAAEERGDSVMVGSYLGRMIEVQIGLGICK